MSWNIVYIRGEIEVQEARMGAALAICPRRQVLQAARRSMEVDGPPEVSFELVSAYPEAKPLQKKMSLSDYKGKPTVIHLYTS